MSPRPNRSKRTACPGHGRLRTTRWLPWGECGAIGRRLCLGGSRARKTEPPPNRGALPKSVQARSDRSSGAVRIESMALSGLIFVPDCGSMARATPGNESHRGVGRQVQESGRTRPGRAVTATVGRFLRCRQWMGTLEPHTATFAGVASCALGCEHGSTGRPAAAS